MTENDKRRERLAALFSKYSDLLYRIALVRLQNKHDAEDAVQDTFVKYLTASFEYSGDIEEKAWLIKVLDNKCRDLHRRKKIREHLSLEDICELCAEDEVSVGVFTAISELSEKFRTVIVLHYLEGFSVEEISLSLSLTKSAVKMRLMRGREELSKILGKENNGV